jgi:hypothetical protein
MPENTWMGQENRIRLRLEVLSLSRIKEARNFRDVWRTTSNDDLFGLGSIHEKLFGKFLSIRDSTPPDDWSSFQQLVEWLEQAISLTNAVFDSLSASGPDFEQALSNVYTTYTWSRDHSDEFSDLVFARLFAHILQSVYRELRLKELPFTDSIYFNHLFTLSMVQADNTIEVPAHFDFFISYKHARYLRIAQLLYEELTRRNLSCWLDQIQMKIEEGEWLSSTEIKKRLKSALASSRLTIFFETYALATADEDERGSYTAYNWQEFEMRHSRSMVSVYYDRGLADVPGSQEKITFNSLEDLAQKLADKFRALPPANFDSLATILERSYPVPALSTAVEQLSQRAKQYFECEIVIANRASLVLLAPGEIVGLNHLTTLSDDVLVNLLRISPYCALAMMRAGLDLERLFRLGVKLNTGKWRLPGEYIFSDIMGFTHMGIADEVRNVQQGGRLDERNVLIGLMEYGLLTAGNAVKKLLDRAVNRLIGRWERSSRHKRPAKSSKRCSLQLENMPSPFPNSSG